MPCVALAEVAGFLDDYLAISRFPDYPNALNGVQVEGSGPIRTVAAAVDASQAVIDAAKDWADLLIVHHGLFWSGLQPLTGPRFGRVKALIETNTALYSAHLPLDAHAEVGNSAVLARKLGLGSLKPFGDYRGAAVGWQGLVDAPLGALAHSLEEATGSRAQILPGGPEHVRTAAVLTGAGASALPEAAAAGLDLLVTGEAQHHHAIDAAELGVSVLLGGHYATETWGVKALASLLEQRFGIEGRFVDSPTGL